MKHTNKGGNYMQNEQIKDPKDWKTGDDPVTPAQKSYIETLAEQVGEEPPDSDLTKAEASEEIDRLRNEAGLE
jgi:hypothetical protein